LVVFSTITKTTGIASLCFVDLPQYTHAYLQ
jgi:hypothetical protein